MAKAKNNLDAVMDRMEQTSLEYFFCAGREIKRADAIGRRIIPPKLQSHSRFSVKGKVGRIRRVRKRIPAIVEKPKTGKQLLGALRASGLVGFWKNRGDIGDSSDYARKLRIRAQERVRG